MSAVERGYFTAHEGPSGVSFTANALALTGWGDQIRGPAVSGLLARSVEEAMANRPELALVRWTVDMIRPAVNESATVTTEIVRAGRRVGLVEARFVQSEQIVARASALYLRPGGQTAGDVWTLSEVPEPPPMELIARGRENRVFYSEGIGWTVEPEPHQNAWRKQLWHGIVPVVEGETPSPFVTVATAADTTNLTTNWGTAGLAYINADVTLYIARLPEPGGVGIAACARTEFDGIAVGSATIFDRTGVIGSCTVSALANATAAVDPRKVFGSQE